MREDIEALLQFILANKGDYKECYDALKESHEHYEEKGHDEGFAEGYRQGLSERDKKTYYPDKEYPIIDITKNSQ